MVVHKLKFAAPHTPYPLCYRMPHAWQAEPLLTTMRRKVTCKRCIKLMTKTKGKR